MAAEETFAGAPSNAFHHAAAAKGAGDPGAGHRTGNFPFHVAQVSAVRLKSRLQAVFRNDLNEQADLVLGKHRHAMGLDERRESTDSTHDVIRHRRFEGAGADEDDDIMDMLGRKIEKAPHRFDMHGVLEQRVLESVLGPINHLGPLRMVRLAEYPPTDVLGFDHENSVRRHDQMIDLGRIVSDRQSNILDETIDFSVKEA